MHLAPSIYIYIGRAAVRLHGRPAEARANTQHDRRAAQAPHAGLACMLACSLGLEGRGERNASASATVPREVQLATGGGTEASCTVNLHFSRDECTAHLVQLCSPVGQCASGCPMGGVSTCTAHEDEHAMCHAHANGHYTYQSSRTLATKDHAAAALLAGPWSLCALLLCGRARDGADCHRTSTAVRRSEQSTVISLLPWHITTVYRDSHIRTAHRLSSSSSAASYKLQRTAVHYSCI